MPASVSVWLSDVSSEPPKLTPCEELLMPVSCSKTAFRSATVVDPLVAIVSVEPKAACSEIGKATVTTNGLDGADPLSVALIEPPLDTPLPPSVVLPLNELPLASATLRSLADTPRAVAAEAISSLTVVDAETAMESVSPYVACSAAGTPTTT